MKILKLIKEYLTTILTIIFVVAIFIGIVVAVIYLRGTNKKIQIVPEFKVIDAKVDPNLDALSESVEIAKNILKKVNK
jgi:hypothetical protein